MVWKRTWVWSLLCLINCLSTKLYDSVYRFHFPVSFWLFKFYHLPKSVDVPLYHSVDQMSTKLSSFNNLMDYIFRSLPLGWSSVDSDRSSTLLHNLQRYLSPPVLSIPDSLVHYCFVRSYSFQTPEAWTIDGRFRSICYMRPLAIWAMQWALTRPKSSNKEMNPEVNEESLHRYHVGFCKVARFLKVPDEKGQTSLLQSLFDYTCKRVFQ